MTASRWWVVSDLHLGPWGADPRGTAEAFARFLAREVAPATGNTHVVLLGDTFELVGLDAQRGRNRLDELVLLNAEVFAEIGLCLRGGVRFHFVCGNHDVDLARPAVADRLVELLSADGPTDQVTVHPWALHEPGLLFAEHGHQHHPLQRLPTLLLASVSGTDDLDPPPMVAWTDRTGRTGTIARTGRTGTIARTSRALPTRSIGPAGWTGSTMRRAAAVARAFSSTRRAERRALTPGYVSMLSAESERIGITPEAARALWRVSGFRTLPAIAGTARRLLSRRLGRAPQGLGMLPAAARVARTLTDHGTPIRWYVSGHTHRAIDAPIPGSTTRYLNTGTWCSDVRDRGPDHDDPSCYPYAQIDVADDGTATGALRYWRDSRRVVGAERLVG